MSTAAWVCFECRLAVRRPILYEADVPCPECRQACVCLGTQIPVPPKAKTREWKALEQLVHKWNREHSWDKYRKAITRRHRIENEIKRLSSLPANEGRAKAVNRLRRQLTELGR